MSRPVIGLTTYAEETRFGVNDTFAAVLPLSYVHAVHVNGGRAVLVTPDDPDVDVLDGLDAIIFTGGSDVDPGLYGEERHATVSVRPQRDKAELMLMRAALAKDLPLFGICRGMQLMTVAYGGKLHQHLPDVPGHNNHRPITGPKFGEQGQPEDTTDFRLFAALVEAARVVRSTTSIAAPPTSRGATGRQP